MKSFEDLQKFLQDVQTRKMALNDEKNVLIGQRATLQETWEDCVFSGEGVAEAKQAMTDLESKIDDLNDHIKILESRTQTSSKIRELAKAVHNDCQHTLKGISNNYEAQATKTLKARDAYLRELAILGEIERVAGKYSFYASEASTYLPERVHVGLGSNRFKDVSLDENLVKTMYKQGKKQ